MFKIFLTDAQKWILLYPEEAARISRDNIQPYTRANIQPFLGCYEGQPTKREDKEQ